mmetsp:Transcript_29448/g.33053  ORF Transcript_29448/g.33053 Transcript_29448/m.33053 type:complete len:84 (+) Transcript_29448:198-449(+)|eukprot:CAMPEP_0170779124 /NCGR_PEP_ID=MMETSP0733-20121128/12799_1 /TAXON_ID=186038 /ORGANISM="Fragilariopsis kerguelensis, Strain L26-C5" /LENGTH=83 /DNA_ID=CAMNT_0011122677 /DNA_START=188 /DNA_END=439 /DNA_ORIENTATION=+
MAIQKKASVSENYCVQLIDNNEEVPEDCKRFASIKAKLDAKANIENRFAGMSAGASSQVRKASLIRRMSTRQGKKEKEKSSWF